MRTIALSILALATAGPALAEVELPIRRAGHWEIRMTMAQGMPEMVLQACTDAETDRRMMQMAFTQMGQTCQRQELRRESEDYVVESDCTMGPVRYTSRSVISGDFQAAYTVRVEGSVTMPGQARPQPMRMVQEARWVSQTCTGGLTAGDIVLPTGQKMNVRNLPGGVPRP